MSMFKNHTIKVSVIFIVALVLRLTILNVMPAVEKKPRSDAARYDQLAMGIIEGKGFQKDGEPIAWRGPIYPYFLAGMYKVFGHNYEAVYKMQAVFGALLCVVMFFIGLLVFNATVGFIAGLFTGIYGPFIYYLDYGGPGFLMSEGMFTFFIAILVYFLVQYVRTNANKYKVLSGVMLAIAALTRPAMIAFIPFLGLWLLYVHWKSWRNLVRDGVIIFGFFFLTISPWTIRNYMVFHEFILISNEAGDIFLYGNHPKASGGIYWVASDLEKQPEKVSGLTETQIKRDKYREGLNYLMADPGRIPYLILKKLMVNWNFFGSDGVYNLFYGLALFFGVLGMAYCLFQLNAFHLLFFALFFWVSLIAAVFFGEPRYRYPVEPYLIIFGAYGVYELFKRHEAKLKPIFIVVSVLVVNFVLLSYSDTVLYFLEDIVP